MQSGSFRRPHYVRQILTDFLSHHTHTLYLVGNQGLQEMGGPVRPIAKVVFYRLTSDTLINEIQSKKRGTLLARDTVQKTELFLLRLAQLSQWPLQTCHLEK